MAINTAIPAGYAVEQVDLALTHAIDEEAIPEDPPMPRDGLVARMRTRSRFGDRLDWLASRGDEVVGRVAVFENKSGSNEHIREVMLHVRPEHRRRGIGSALFSAAMAAIPDDGTVNAGTKAPMLAINDRMGFREAWWMDIWQMPLADAKAYGR